MATKSTKITKWGWPREETLEIIRPQRRSATKDTKNTKDLVTYIPDHFRESGEETLLEFMRTYRFRDGRQCLCCGLGHAATFQCSCGPQPRAA